MSSVNPVATSILLFLAFSVLWPSKLQAAEPVIEEIVVTAQKRSERLQDVPLAVSAFTAEFMAQRNIDEIDDLQFYEPSLRFRETFSTRDSNIEIRGIGSNGQNAGIDSSVGIYLDGVFIPRPTGLIGSLSDVQQIEVLKGPQGTLYGANTPAGLINVRTRRPTQEFEAQAQVGFGDFDMREVSGFVSGGLTENIAGRLAVWMHEDDGHTKLVTGGRANGREDWGVRAKTLWSLDETTEIEFVLDYSKIETNCCVAEWIDISDAALAGFDEIADRLNLNRAEIFPSRDGDDGFMDRGETINHVSYADGDAHEVFEQMGVSVRLDKLLAGDVLRDHELEVILAYRDWDSDQRADVDNQGVDLGILDPQIEDQETFSAEIRLTSPADQTVEYLGGLYYYYQDSFFQQATSFQMPLCLITPFADAQVANGTIPDTVEGRSRCAGAARMDQWTQENESIAAFGDITFNLTEALSLSLGARVTQDDKKGELDNRLFDSRSQEIVEEFGLSCPGCEFGVSDATINGFGVLFAGVAFEDDVDEVEETWSATIQYDLRSTLDGSEMMTYFRAAKGYKAPGINARPIRRDDIPRTFGPETSTLYELGLKSTLFSERLRANLAVYFNEFDDLQQLATNTQRDLGVSGTFVQNAGTLEHYGVEFDYAFYPTSWLTLTGAVAYLDSEFEEFDGAPCASPDTYSDVPPSQTVEGACDQTGFRAPFTPEWRTNHTARVAFPVSGADLEWWAQASVIYTDDQYLEADRDRRSFQKAYTLYDVAAGVGSLDGRWEARAFVKNVTDKEYLVAVLGGPSLAGFQGLGSDSFIGYLGEPRTFAASIQLNF